MASHHRPHDKEGEMVAAKPIDFDHALLDPRSVFKEPSEVLVCPDLDDARKLRILECWRHDAIELQTFDDEMISSGEEPMLKRVLDAMDALKRQAAGH
jgi:hypothetical protein